MDKKPSWEDAYQKKYVDNGSDNGVLVASQTSGSRVLDLLGFARQGDIYPEFLDKQVTDIGGGFSTLAFELYPSAKTITIVDPAFVSEHLGEVLEQERKRAGNRLYMTQQCTAKDVAQTLLSQQEIYAGIEKRQRYEQDADQKIVRNPSYAQDIQGIAPKSQDVVFFNFVLDKFDKTNNPLLTEEIRKALQNAFRILRSGGKIMGVHDISSHADEIIYALDNLLVSGYRVEYDQKENYLVFCLTKE